MPENNLRQAMVPEGLSTTRYPGTAPGLKAQVNGVTIYAVPGVPWEMKQMVTSCILPDIRAETGLTSVIRSRTLRTWGDSESGLAEKLSSNIKRLDKKGQQLLHFWQVVLRV